jgi:hypothetical protein
VQSRPPGGRCASFGGPKDQPGNLYWVAGFRTPGAPPQPAIIGRSRMLRMLGWRVIRQDGGRHREQH